MSTTGNLVLTQDKKNFDDPDTGDEIIARTIYPSEPCGGWVGNTEKIREWKVHKKVNPGLFRACTDEEIIEYEKRLGEWPSFRIWTHSALGRVSSPAV